MSGVLCLGDDVEKGLAVFKVAGHITAAAFLSQLTNVLGKKQTTFEAVTK